jgi:hypothetical protein
MPERLVQRARMENPNFVFRAARKSDLAGPASFGNIGA